MSNEKCISREGRVGGGDTYRRGEVFMLGGLEVGLCVCDNFLSVAMNMNVP